MGVGNKQRAAGDLLVDEMPVEDTYTIEIVEGQTPAENSTLNETKMLVETEKVEEPKLRFNSSTDIKYVWEITRHGARVPIVSSKGFNVSVGQLTPPGLR